ncbi:hypothetical protein AAC387_Pa11g0085 [Persea americana]
MAMEGAGAGLSCVLQNLQRMLSSPLLDGLERARFVEKEKQTSDELGWMRFMLDAFERLEFGEKEKKTSLVARDLKRPGFGENEEQMLGSCLSAIAAVLQDAERRQFNEIAVKDWLQKLKDAVYDAEERVDKIVVAALELKAKKRYISSSTILSLHYIREMLVPVERFGRIAKEMNDFHFKEGFVETQPQISITRQTSSWSDVIESEVYARDCEKQELIDPLVNFENKEEVLMVLPVVGVGVGMGGIEKTTLARLVFHDERIIAHFNLRMWVSAAEPDFDVPTLVKKILESAVGAYVYHPSSSSSDLLQTQLQEKLHGKRYLLVLDDARNEERYKWNRLKACLKCGAMGSRILVTTCSDTVASIMGTLPQHDLGRLSEEHSWSLFQKQAKPHPDFLSIGKEMVDRCGGDALAVKTLGGLMFTKTTKEEWESVRSSDFWKAQGNDREILPALKVSYDHLTSSLKQCFVYCAVFPKGCEIDKNKLIKQWIAHGFIHSNEESELLEERGECYFNDLLQSPIKTLPKEMRRMISLRHIEFDVAKDLHLPSGIGELACLRTLPKFVVGQGSGCGIEELKCLNQLSGDIRIEGLDNIREEVCARKANLKGKQHLNSLELSWPSIKAVAGTGRNAEEMIENLEPHSNLKKIVFENYPGLNFPSWMTVLTNLVDIKLWHCNGCEHLPPLGKLCFLESLKIEEMSAVKYIVEFDGSHNYKGQVFKVLFQVVSV